jgi:hypothetical protein
LSLSPACIAGDDGDDGATIEPDCTREGDFVVELGQGQEAFEPIAADEEPMLYFGAQGGMHLILAAHLVTPNPLDIYDVALVAEAGQEPCTDGDCSSWVTVGQIAPTIEGSSRIHPLDVGEIEITNLFLVLDNWNAPVRRLTIELSDACDRRATAVRTFVSP